MSSLLSLSSVSPLGRSISSFEISSSILTDGFKERTGTDTGIRAGDGAGTGTGTNSGVGSGAATGKRVRTGSDVRIGTGSGKRVLTGAGVSNGADAIGDARGRGG
jgi:hypothetical protein